jgi:DNA-binding transcriptional LysR family regulator
MIPEGGRGAGFPYNEEEQEMSEILDLNDLYLFAKVVEHRGYSAAARALGIPTSKLSRRVSELERQLGAHLINRTTRSISLSNAGENFYRHCVAVVAEAKAARESVERALAAPQGLVRISCPVGILMSGVAPILSRYMADNPAVRVHVEATNRPVDVVEEGFDLAVRVRLPPLEDSDLALRVLGDSRMTLVCSRWFIAQHGEPTSANELSKLPTLSMTRAGNKPSWRLTGPDGIEIDVPHTPRLATDDLSMLLTGALDGIGIALLPEELVRKYLADGSLVEVLPGLKTAPGLVHLVFASRRGLVPAVRSLIEALAEGFKLLGGRA